MPVRFVEKRLNSKPVKSWRYGDKDVQMYTCKNCNKSIRVYIGDGYQYTIPKKK